MIYVLGIVIVVMCVPVTAILTEHKRKVVKIQGELLRDEIELEKLRQENFIIETEKMKIELEKMRLDYTPNQNDILKL
jgi:hypothetical protein